MDFTLTTEQQQIREETKKVCREFPGAYWRDLDSKKAYPDAFVPHLLGLLGGSSSHWRLRAYSPPSSPVVHRRRRQARAMPPPPDRLPPSRQQRRVLGSPKAALMPRTTARARAIRSASAERVSV